jgi:lysophospholipase L1-like esterase
MKNKIRLLFGFAALFLISVSSVIWYLNFGNCQDEKCGPGSALASVTYSVCITGDSISYGVGDSAGGWAERLGYYLLDRYPGSSVGNYSLPGATSLGVKSVYSSGCGSQGAQVSIIAVGLNDSAHSMPIEAFRNNLSDVYRQAAAVSVKVVFIGLTRVNEGRLDGQNYRNSSIKSYDQELKSLAGELGASYIDMSGVLIEDDLSEDGIHPNDFGHEKMFLAVKDYLENAEK